VRVCVQEHRAQKAIREEEEGVCVYAYVYVSFYEN